MYYKLKNNFKLRGWKLLPTGVIDGRNGSFQFLPVDVYKTLRLCNGILAEDSPIFSPQQRKYLAELEQAGFIEKTENPSSLESDQEYKFYDNRFLQSAHWSITGNCNCRCRHCYMSAPHAKMGEISSAQCMNIIEQLSECGVQRIIISGGEALVRKDFFEIVDKLLEKKICISAVMSNGLLVNEKLLDEFERRGIYPEFNMSFDGVGGWHDWLRGIKGAEKAVLHAFKICAERGFPTGTEYCLQGKY
jgi:sulfatase maturation enzyme AslB (radical SAM superfamily)